MFCSSLKLLGLTFSLTWTLYKQHATLFYHKDGTVLVSIVRLRLELFKKFSYENTGMKKVQETLKSIKFRDLHNHLYNTIIAVQDFSYAKIGRNCQPKSWQPITNISMKRKICENSFVENSSASFQHLPHFFHGWMQPGLSGRGARQTEGSCGSESVVRVFRPPFTKDLPKQSNTLAYVTRFQYSAIKTTSRFSFFIFLVNLQATRILSRYNTKL